MSEQTITDSPTKRTEYRELEITQAVAFLEGIRQRRLRSVEAYEQLQKEKAEKQLAATTARWEKHVEMYKKEVDQADRVIAKLEKRIQSMRAASLELEACA